MDASTIKYLALFLSVALISIGKASAGLTSKCGSVLQGKSGKFHSPNYPSHYPENVKCTWKLVASNNAAEKIVITFSKFNVEWGGSCMYDYVQILDHNKQAVGYKVCGKKDDIKVEVPGSTAYVIFYSDYEATEQGFTAAFEAVAAPKPLSKGDCDFDNGICKDWRHDKSGDFNWISGSGSTPTLLTGPDSDHSGKGKYLFIESSNPRQVGDKARIVSTSLQNVRCLSFYYHMNGLLGMGSLHVYLKDSSGEMTSLWSKSGDQGRKWKKVHLPLPVDGSTTFKIIIEGTVGKSDYSDIAIDDISFSNKTCKSNDCTKYLQGGSGQFFSPNFPDKYSHNSRCMWKITGPEGTKKIVLKFHSFDLEDDTTCSKDFIQISDKNGQQVGPRYCGFYPRGFGVKISGDKADLYFSSNALVSRKGFNASFEAILMESKDDCDFDTNLCLWTNSKLDEFEWTIKSRRTPSYFTGPFGDYLGLGKYAYIESSYREEGDRAQLVSQAMSGTRCLQFMYNMRGIYMGSINVMQVYQGNKKVLLSISGNHGRLWHKAVVDIPDVAQAYKIVIEGVVGGSFTSDAAMDEIIFTPGSCPSQACGDLLTASYGVIETPNYPENYPNNVVCQWKINPLPYHARVDITFEKFDVENSSGCGKDSVEISDGYKTRLGEKLCGTLENMQSNPVRVAGSSAYLKFTSDSSGTRHGFKANYQVSQKRASCGGEMAGRRGNFTSPNYPNNYPADEICDWEITGDTNLWLEVSFKDFDIDDTVVCYYNYILIYDSIHGKEIGRYCGRYAPAPIIIPSHVANIRFATARHGAAKGFVAEWRLVPSDTGKK